MWVTLIIALLATQISGAKTKDDPVVSAKPKELTSPRAGPASTAREYFPPPESEGGWRTLSDPDSIRRDAGMDPAKLSKLREWLRQSDHRQFAVVVIRRGHLVMHEKRGKSAVTDTGRIASCSKAICATVLASASEESQKGHTPRKMTFDDRAFEFIPWAQPLSDPRKARITVKQLLNHTSGICPEATGAPIDGKWEFILGYTDDARTASLAFDPGTGCGYSTHALDHAALVCENVTGKPYDRFAIEALFRPLGIEHWWFQYYDGGPKYGRHPSSALGMSARDMARIAYCMAHGGRWNGRQVIPGLVRRPDRRPHPRRPGTRDAFPPQRPDGGWSGTSSRATHRLNRGRKVGCASLCSAAPTLPMETKNLTLSAAVGVALPKWT